LHRERNPGIYHSLLEELCNHLHKRRGKDYLKMLELHKMPLLQEPKLILRLHMEHMLEDLETLPVNLLLITVIDEEESLLFRSF